MRVVDPSEMEEGPDPGFFPASRPSGFREEKIFKKEENEDDLEVNRGCCWEKSESEFSRGKKIKRESIPVLVKRSGPGCLEMRIRGFRIQQQLNKRKNGSPACNNGLRALGSKRIK